MRKIKGLFIIMSMSLFVLLGCEDDKMEPTSVPEFASIDSNIASLPGETLTFEAVITDPNGIETVNLNYEPWYLDKTIDKSTTDSIYTTYHLSYGFEVPAEEVVGSTHTVSITATNFDGGTTTQNVVVVLDKDIVSPDVQINSPTNGTTILLSDDAQICLNVTVADENLADVQISGDLVDEYIEVDETTYNYSNCFEVTEEGVYTFDITAIDKEGNATTESVYVNVRGELAFDNLYITEASSDSELNKEWFGAAFATDASESADEDGFVFSTVYYSSHANTNVRLTPQSNSFSPYSFGASSTEEGKLVLGDGADVEPITLPAVGYYQISVDLKTMEYTIAEITPSGTPYDQVYIIGTGIQIGETSTCVNNTTGELTCWSFQSSKPLVADAANPYRWTLDIYVEEEAESGGNIGFILNANTEGWAPFWRHATDDPSSTLVGAGDNWIFDDAADRGKAYTMIFDTYLNRISLLTNE